ncbi:MAG: signal peptidase II [Phycisphaerales bacterium]|jgi:signal peptidase II
MVLVVTSVLGLATDLSSKWLAFQHVAGAPVVVERSQVLKFRNPSDLIPMHAPVQVVPGVLDFTLLLNPGAVFGIGAGKRWVFVFFTLGALVFALGLFAKWTVKRDWVSHVGLGLLISGGLGNLYDRLMYACVRDFIRPLPGMHLPFGWSYPWGGREVWPYVSNVADLYLIIGVGMLIWRALRPHPLQREAANADGKRG